MKSKMLQFLFWASSNSKVALLHVHAFVLATLAVKVHLTQK